MNSPAPSRADIVECDLVAEVRQVAPDRIDGFVYDARDLDARFVVELYLDGQPCAVARANVFDAGLLHRGVADGCYRFSFHVEPERLRGTPIEVRLANIDRSLGAPAPLPSAWASAWPSGIGEIDWHGGLRFFGWLDDDAGEQVRAFVGGECVARARVDRWTHVGRGREGMAKRAFALTLPVEFADGRLRQVNFIDTRGRALVGSPCPFFAFRDGLALLLESHADLESERIRGRLFDEIFPRSAPFEAFPEWRQTFAPADEAPALRARIAVAIVGERGVEATLHSLEAQEDTDCIVGVLGQGEGQTAFVPAELRSFLDEAPGPPQFVVFALAGTRFEPNALARLVSCWRVFPKARLAYGDVTIATADGGDWPLAFPAFDYERMLEQGYGAYLFAMPIEEARKALEVGADSLYRLFNAPWDTIGREPGDDGEASAFVGAVHKPGFLARLPALDRRDGAHRLALATAAHLNARGVVAEVGAGPGALLPATCIRRAVARGRVSILVPTRDRLDLLQPCLDSLRRTIDLGAHELIVIDNGSTGPATLDYFDELAANGIRVLRVGGPFNFARLINAGASLASGDFLLLLNNDVEALDEGWLDEMRSRAAEPDVGAVGAALLWPSGVYQHCGIVLGVGFAPAHAFNDRAVGDPGYGDLLAVAHECGATTGACLMTPRHLFLGSGGLDAARFQIDYNDVDYCLRLRALGYRVVMTPHARLTHRESASRGVLRAQDDLDRYSGALRRLRAMWGEALLNDPCYSPLLSLDGAPYGSLAWPPRRAAPRSPRCPTMRPTPPGF